MQHKQMITDTRGSKIWAAVSTDKSMSIAGGSVPAERKPHERIMPLLVTWAELGYLQEARTNNKGETSVRGPAHM